MVICRSASYSGPGLYPSRGHVLTRSVSVNGQSSGNKQTTYAFLREARSILQEFIEEYGQTLHLLVDSGDVLPEALRIYPPLKELAMTPTLTGSTVDIIQELLHKMSESLPFTMKPDINSVNNSDVALPDEHQTVIALLAREQQQLGYIENFLRKDPSFGKTNKINVDKVGVVDCMDVRSAQDVVAVAVVIRKVYDNCISHL